MCRDLFRERVYEKNVSLLIWYFTTITKDQCQDTGCISVNMIIDPIRGLQHRSSTLPQPEMNVFDLAVTSECCFTKSIFSFEAAVYTMDGLVSPWVCLDPCKNRQNSSPESDHIFSSYMCRTYFSVQSV